MKIRMKLCLLIVLGLLVFSTPLVSANEVTTITVPELGTISVPADIEVSESITKQGSKGFNFLAKDRDAYRTLAVFSKLTPNIKLGAITANPDIIKTFVGQDKILKLEPLHSITVGEKKILKASITSFRDPFAFHLNVYFFETEAGVVMSMFICADGDSAYWEPVGSKIIAQAVK